MLKNIENEMSQSLKATNESALVASRNLVYAFILLRVISTLDLGRGVPLFAILHQPGFLELRWFLAITLLGVWMIRKSDDTLLLALSAATIVFHLCSGYSSLGAFSFAPFYLFLFALLFFRKPTDNIKADAAILIGLIFLTSAVQKINPHFLAGEEFEMSSPFLSYLHSWQPGLNLFSSALIRRSVASLAIGIELIIGFGIFFRPAIFAHAALIFVLSLAIIHPPILYVYFFFLPLVVLIPNVLPENVGRLLAKPGPLIPLACALTIKVIVLETTETSKFSIVIFAVTFFLIANQALGLSKMHLTQNVLRDRRIRFTRAGKTFVIPAVLLAVFAGSFFILPSPLGFSMFAARRFLVPTYTLEVLSSEACHFAGSSWRFSPVTDSSIEFNEDGNCRIRFPTKSGLAAITVKICSPFPKTKFKLIDGSVATSLDCS